MLESDAKSYYDHFKYYIENISRGIYPLWEPTRQSGLPIEFFMQRIGSYNPLAFVILILNKMGLSYPVSYFWFLSLYYFMGMIGFYLLAKQIFKDARIAFAAFLLLMFSSMGTRLFDSYINLVFIPMIWFFYFLLAFYEDPKKHNFLGLVFSTMLLIVTYIPFYFFTIFVFFLLCFTIFYFSALKIFLKNLLKFIKRNKLLVLLCSLTLVLCMVPGILLFQDAKGGEIVFPYRNYDYKHTPSPPDNLSVDVQNVTRWGVVEDLLYSISYYTDMRKFRFAVFYVPIFAYLILFSALFTNMNKKLLFFFSLGFIMFLLGTPANIPVYYFLRKYVFYFKYFRNMHFFLWLIILPLMILFLCEQLRLFLKFQPKTKAERRLLIFFLIMVHGGFAVFLLMHQDALLSSFLVIAGSLAFFIFYFQGKFKGKAHLFLMIFLLLITAQPLEVYSYFNKNARRIPEGAESPYRYKGRLPYLEFHLPSTSEHQIVALDKKEGEDPSDENTKENAPNMYMGTVWHDFLVKNIDAPILSNYRKNKLLVYDKVEYIHDGDLDLNKFSKALQELQNLAFVSSFVFPDTPLHFPGKIPKQAQIITSHSREARVSDYNVNEITLKTNFHSKKFLVYNDNFHRGWTAFIDGKKVNLWKANFAFKGLWIPEGEHVVTFRFREFWRHALNYLLMAVFMIVFFSVLWTSAVYRAKQPEVI